MGTQVLLSHLPHIGMRAWADTTFSVSRYLGGQNMASGICKLTGISGPLVKAHILPAALTYPAEKGLPFAQAGRDSAPIKRWNSWYDTSIVTREGEDILAEYDNWAIEKLRQHRLVWSGWGKARKFESSDSIAIAGGNGYGAREITGLDGGMLRLFFLSLLWRAAVSKLHEFAEVQLHASDIRRLRRMLVDRDPTPLERFPISLIQLSSKGPIHNHAPIAQRKLRDITKPNGPTVPIFRFYLDGLIAHVHRESSCAEIEGLGPMLLGVEARTVVTVVPFEESWQRENLDELIREAENRWPDRLAQIPGFGNNA